MSETKVLLLMFNYLNQWIRLSRLFRSFSWNWAVCVVANAPLATKSRNRTYANNQRQLSGQYFYAPGFCCCSSLHLRFVRCMCWCGFGMWGGCANTLNAFHLSERSSHDTNDCVFFCVFFLPYLLFAFAHNQKLVVATFMWIVHFFKVFFALLFRRACGFRFQHKNCSTSVPFYFELCNK